MIRAIQCYPPPPLQSPPVARDGLPGRGGETVAKRRSPGWGGGIARVFPPPISSITQRKPFFGAFSAWHFLCFLGQVTVSRGGGGGIARGGGGLRLSHKAMWQRT